jgi:hypothetical protein
MHDRQPTQEPHMSRSVSLSRPRLAAAVLALGCLLATPLAARADPWSGTLHDGSQLRVDPDTHRAIRDQGGAERPMWDGTHRLDDGSVVIIRDGTAVPTKQMMETWDGGAEPKDAAQAADCARLVQRVCGPQDACGSADACLSARKLRDEAVPAGAAAAGEQACAKALSDPAFPVCTQVARGATAGQCARLVERVCGADGRCAKSPACDPARQLLGLESEERAADPSGVTATGDQCREAMVNPFFKPCP